MISLVRAVNMVKQIEINKNNVNFDVLWKIKEINVDTITFVKYKIKRMMSIIDDNNETIVLDEVIGEETHKCVPDIILENGGKVGEVIKGFKLEKKGKAVKVTNIIKLE